MNIIPQEVSPAVKSWSSYAAMMHYQPEMVQRFYESWNIIPNMKRCSSNQFMIEVRESVFVQIQNFCQKFNKILQDKLNDYDLRKAHYVQSKHVKDVLTLRAFEKMQQLFSAEVPVLLQIASKIDECRKSVYQHFEFVKDISLRNEPSLDESIISRVSQIQTSLTNLRVEVGNALIGTDEKIANLTRRGEALGPCFRTEPAIFLMGTHIIAPKNSEISNMPVAKAVEIIESIKQERTVQQSLQLYYFLCMNAIRTLSKMEKGVGRILAGYVTPPALEAVPGGPAITVQR